MKQSFYMLGLIIGVSVVAGCGQKPASRSEAGAARSAPAVAAAWPDPVAMVLVPQEGQGKTDKEIRHLQGQVQPGRNRNLALEQLGWAFVSKARESFDAGYYKLAEQCALAIEQEDPHSEGALLLRGHVLDSLHRFHEAEILARQLVDQRGRGFDYGLLGDTLMEQGRLTEAVAAYQKMMDLRPDLHAYVRAAHIRWLKGDLEGAIEAMSLATGAGTPGDAESAAWANTRLAGYEFQAGHFATAARRCDVALAFQTNYPPALLLRGKLLLAGGQPGAAVAALQNAEQLNPLPEYKWALADALREAGREKDAARVEEQICSRGAAADPRTFALYLATRRQSPSLAVQLAREELATRGDVFTHDALAWALWAGGDSAGAQAEMKLALAEGTQDSRLFLHAAAIALAAGHPAEALKWSQKSSAIPQMLLPSERKELDELSGRLGISTESVARQPAKQISAF
jgi:tetratricopeptide (TPR) repeat protein